MGYFLFELVLVLWWIGAAKSGIDGILNPVSLIMIITLVVVLVDSIVGIRREKKEEERLVQESREKYGEAWYQCHLYLQSDEYRKQLREREKLIMSRGKEGKNKGKNKDEDKNGGIS